MDLDDKDQEEEFHKDTPMPNIWSLDHSEVDNDTGHDDGDKDDVKFTGSVITHEEDSELEKPSFLRRLKNRRKKSNQTDK